MVFGVGIKHLYRGLIEICSSDNVLCSLYGFNFVFSPFRVPVFLPDDIIEFYKNNCLIDKLESLGFKRVVKEGRVINVKDDLICDISYDFNISAIVCKIASKRRSLRREYDYEQGFYLCESVISDLDGFMKE